MICFINFFKIKYKIAILKKIKKKNKRAQPCMLGILKRNNPARMPGLFYYFFPAKKIK
jgi:hypothetical protein